MDERSRLLGDLCGGEISGRLNFGGEKIASSSSPTLRVDTTGCCVARGLDVLSVDADRTDNCNDADDDSDDDMDEDGLCLQS